ncbi:MAG: adenylate cyclase [Methylococcaceae bacterium]|nr:adenylate cyclase [Methylococcaceae bacterium]
MVKQHNDVHRLTDRIMGEIQSSLSQGLENSPETQLRNRILAVLNQKTNLSRSLEQRPMTIIMADIRGFTALAERHPPEAVFETLDCHLGVMAEIIARYGGMIDKVMGDCIMVLFGAREHQDDHVQRALNCAVEMQQAIGRVNRNNQERGFPPIYMGIGIDTGTVAAGVIGPDWHREYTVIGPEVNMAARIEAHAMRGQILISQECQTVARDDILVGESLELQVKGRSETIRVHELLGSKHPYLMMVPRCELRKSPRVSIRMPCYFQRLQQKKVLPQMHLGQVVDVGYHGLGMISPVHLELRGEIKMALSLQLLGGMTSDVYARIVSPLEQEGSGFRCRMEFTDIDAEGQQTIKRFVDSQLGSGRA